MIDGFQEEGKFIGIVKLRVTDDLRKLIIRHYQCHKQQGEWYTQDTSGLAYGHSDSARYTTLLRWDRPHHRADVGRSK